MKKAIFSLWQLGFYTVGYFATSSSITLAQITTDGTVGTQVEQDGNVSEITGGETRGGNLFHSFDDFSIPTGNEAFFDNANDISNIFSRVTGGNISNIDGAIRANGSADLFLINPAGIILGENARLDIGGSFYGSSASSILFEEGEFSAADLENPPLLTVNAPIGLGFRDNPGDITNRANFGRVEQTFEQDITSEIIEVSRVTDIKGLEVDPGQDIALIGGDIFLEGSGINAPGGNITLGGLSGAGEVLINADGSFSFPDDVIKADLSLSDSALVSIIDDGGGSINIDVNNLSAIEQSRILSGIAEDMGNPNAVGGDIIINADESVTLIGSGLFEEPELDLDTSIRSIVGLPPSQLNNPEEDTSSAIGNSGSVLVNTKLFNMTKRSKIGVGVYGTGNGQDVTINADTISINEGAIISQVRPDGRGNSGNVNLNTNDFSATNLSFVITDNQGVEGNAGDINLVATGSIVLQDDIFSAFISEISADTVGDAGDINFTANSLLIDNSFQLLALTRGKGDGGDINLEIADSLVISNGADVIAQIEVGGEGNAGNIAIETNTFELSGDSIILADTRSLGNSGSITINAQESISLVGSTISTGITETAEGGSGDITVTSPQVSLKDRAIISSSTAGIGEGGDVNINSELISVDNFALITSSSITDISQDAGSVNLNSDRIILSNGGIINSATSSNFDGGQININARLLEMFSGGVIQTATESNGNAGNINLNISDRIILNGNNAPNRPSEFDFEEDILNNLVGKTGIFANTNNDTLSNGGNITIDSNFIIAFPGGNNDILASSQQGQGGNITINAKSLLGIEERPLSDSTNDINASSQFGLDGTISIITPGTNPIEGTTELPSNIVAPGEITQQACEANRESVAKNRLDITGRGGISTEPGSPLNSSAISINSKSDSTSTSPQAIETSQGKIQPARGIEVNESGQIRLTAYRTSQSGERIPEGSVNCGQV